MQRSVDLTPWIGSNIRIAFRHRSAPHSSLQIDWVTIDMGQTIQIGFRHTQGGYVLLLADVAVEPLSPPEIAIVAPGDHRP